MENKIEKLVDALTSANPVLMSYENVKIVELNERKNELMQAIADMTAEAVNPEKMERISGHLDDCDNVTFNERRQAADGLIP